MTTSPELRRGARLWPGLIAILLFVGFAIVILQPSADALVQITFGLGDGFAEGESVIANIGYALLGLESGGIEAESFLVALIVMAVLLDAALGGAVLLASRDEELRRED